MPYISVSVSKTLDTTQREAIKSELGSIITLIPGKTEAVTMVRIEDGCTLYLGGRPLDNGAFIDVRLYGNATLQGKQAFTEAVFSMLGEQLGAAPEHIYLNIFEMDNWGSRGRLK